jgi:hypothetical protein
MTDQGPLGRPPRGASVPGGAPCGAGPQLIHEQRSTHEWLAAVERKPNHFSEIGVLDLKCGGRRALHLAESGLAVSHTEFNSSGINNAGGLHSSLLG